MSPSAPQTADKRAVQAGEARHAAMTACDNGGPTSIKRELLAMFLPWAVFTLAPGACLRPS